jgi:hypothetical protein
MAARAHRITSAPPRDRAKDAVDDEFRARATVIRLIVWWRTVTMIAAAVTWPSPGLVGG